MKGWFLRKIDNMVSNILTVDLEEWFVVENLKGEFNAAEWENLPGRVEENTMALLELFRRHRVRATFFVLGWIAQKYPHLIGELAYSGHEIGCHSFGHNRIDRMDEKAFRLDTEKALDVITRTSGRIPLGYRAPSWSINSRIPWAWEVLAELGFKYDSSVFPIKHDIYGEPGAPREFFQLPLASGRTLYELPASTVKFFGRNIPFGGGGYLRHSPYWYTSRLIKNENKAGRPVMVYIHPWEIDENQPRLKNLSAFQKFRQYGSVGTLRLKLERLLEEFDFAPAADYVTRQTRRKIGFETR